RTTTSSICTRTRGGTAVSAEPASAARSAWRRRRRLEPRPEEPGREPLVVPAVASLASPFAQRPRALRNAVGDHGPDPRDGGLAGVEPDAVVEERLEPVVL